MSDYNIIYGCGQEAYRIYYELYKRLKPKSSIYLINDILPHFGAKPILRTLFVAESPFRQLIHDIAKVARMSASFKRITFDRETHFPDVKLNDRTFEDDFIPSQSYLKTADFWKPSLRALREETGMKPYFLFDRLLGERAFSPSDNQKLRRSFFNFYTLSKRFFSFKTHYYSLKRWYVIYGNKKVGSYSLLSWRFQRKVLSDFPFTLNRFKWQYQNSKNMFIRTFENPFYSIPQTFETLKIRYGSFLKERIKKEFLLQNRTAFLEKKAVVVASRNLVRERRNLQYKESYRKYKPYFIKPNFSWKDNYSNYIDYIHEHHLIPLFNIKKEIQIIKENKKLLLAEPNLPPNWIYSSLIIKKLKFIFSFYHDFYYDVVVDFYIWFPFYDFYNALSFLF
jgi:hypothetical protein